MGVDGLGQFLVDAVRAAHRVVPCAVGIGAAAAHAYVNLAAQLGLHVAHERRVARHAALERGEVLGRLVEPVRIAVQNDAHRSPLLPDQRVQRIKREGIAVQPAHDVEHVARVRRLAGECVGGNAVVHGTDAAGVLEHPTHLAGHGA